MQTTTIKATNIKCGGCANQISTSLLKINGVDNVSVNVDEGEIQLDISDENILPEVKSKLSSMGYPENDPSSIQTAKSYVSCMIGRVKA